MKKRAFLFVHYEEGSCQIISVLTPRQHFLCTACFRPTMECGRNSKADPFLGVMAPL